MQLTEEQVPAGELEETIIGLTSWAGSMEDRAPSGSAAIGSGRSRPTHCLKAAAAADEPKPNDPVFSATPNKNEHGTGKDAEGKQELCMECFSEFLSFPWVVSSSLCTSGQPK